MALDRSHASACPNGWQSATLRYSAARPSRTQGSADSLVRESEATAEQRADKAVRAPQKSSRLATMSRDTDTPTLRYDGGALNRHGFESDRRGRLCSRTGF